MSMPDPSFFKPIMKPAGFDAANNDKGDVSGASQQIERPKEPPSGTKDFKKIAEKRTSGDESAIIVQGEEKNIPEELVALFGALDKEKVAVDKTLPFEAKTQETSIFLLSGNKSKKVMNGPFTGGEEGAAAMAAAAAMAKSASNRMAIDDDVAKEVAAISSDDDRPRSPAFSMDLPSGMTPPVVPQGGQFEGVRLTTGERPIMSAELSMLTEKMVDGIQTMRLQGETVTTIRLGDNAGLFAGVTITINAFDMARGQFNVTFAGLTNAAKLVMDQGANMDALKLAIEAKGMALHIVTTTTQQYDQVIRMDPTSAELKEKQEQQQREQRGRDQPQR